MRGSGCKCTVRDDHDDDEDDEDDDGDVDDVWDALGLPCMLKPIQTSLAPGLLPSRPSLSNPLSVWMPAGEAPGADVLKHVNSTIRQFCLSQSQLCASLLPGLRHSMSGGGCI